MNASLVSEATASDSKSASSFKYAVSPVSEADSSNSKAASLLGSYSSISEA